MKLFVNILAILILSSSCKIHKNKLNNDASAFISFSKGQKISSANFTGTVWLNMLVNQDTTFNINAGNVTFEPKARTNWHYHPGGQVLLITNGEGRYQEQGKMIQKIKKGDVIKCEPNVIHWHGASPSGELTHIAIGTNLNKGNVVWLSAVTDKEYNQIE